MSTRLILDTDIDTDCDDAGALAVLHGLARRGEAELLGVVCSIPVRWCAYCVRAINAWYGRTDVPVGLVRVPGWETAPRYAPYREARALTQRLIYNETIGRRWLEQHPDDRPAEAVSLYRTLLAAQPDEGVVLCAIGTLTALEQLLRSAPDAVSPLSGRALVARKVRLLVTMALGSFPQGRDTFNWAMDLPAAATVVNEWPAPLAVSEWGEAVLTGARFGVAAPEGHPVREAYRIYLEGEARNRMSWDLLAALYAVRGAGEWFEETRGHTIHLDAATGEHSWHPAPDGAPLRMHLRPRVTSEVLAGAVEDLMIESLRERR